MKPFKLLREALRIDITTLVEETSLTEEQIELIQGMNVFDLSETCQVNELLEFYSKKLKLNIKFLKVCFLRKNAPSKENALASPFLNIFSHLIKRV